MHNWLKGVLQHHFRIQWGFDVWLVENLKRKKDEAGAQLPHSKFAKGGVDESTMDKEFDSYSELSSTDNGDVSAGLFSEENIKTFKNLQSKIFLPSQLERLPQPLGKRKAGKWKANHWYCLFEYIIPLVVIEMFVTNHEKFSPHSRKGQILANVGALCCFTSVVCSKKVTPSDPGIFTMYYTRYNKTSEKLFENLNTQPNHHYALHIPEQIETWGSLNQVVEFTGKRLIGFLQKIKTNLNIIKSFGGWFFILIVLHKQTESYNAFTEQVDRTIMQKACALQQLIAKDGGPSNAGNDKKRSDWQIR
jgi:hypothetical protein